MPLCIVTPPPNLTGKLHIGHILNISIQEFIKGTDNLFNDLNTTTIFGFDHAGLYAEILARKALIASGTPITQESLIQQISQNSSHFKATMLKQLSDFSIDVGNIHLNTFSSHASSVVTAALNLLKERHLLKQEHRVINFDIDNQTVISDIETRTSVSEAVLYYVKYYIEASNEYIIVATTRPETIEGDIAVAIHPEDTRYLHLKDKKLVNPFTNQLIPIVTSTDVIQEFGTGCLKLTPQFSHKDANTVKELALKYKIKVLIDPKTGLFEKTSLFHGQTFIQAKESAIKFLQKHELLTRTQDIKTNIVYSVRTDKPIFQFSSEQVFVNIQKLVSQSPDIEAANIQGCSGKNEAKTFLKQLKTWCISRQTEYGHKYLNYTLDTWFASSLYSVLASKHTTHKLLYITGYDIIFFWIYKMFYMSGLFMDQPIAGVLTHGIICDSEGQKISKSKNNVPNIEFETKREYEIYRLYLILHNPFIKRIKMNPSLHSLARTIIAKLESVVKFCNTRSSLEDEYVMEFQYIEAFVCHFASQPYIARVKSINSVLQRVRRYYNKLIDLSKENNINISKSCVSSLQAVLKYLSTICPVISQEISSSIVEKNYFPYTDTVCTEIILAVESLNMHYDKEVAYIQSNDSKLIKGIFLYSKELPLLINIHNCTIHCMNNKIIMNLLMTKLNHLQAPH